MTDTMTLDDRRELEALLPWYLNGSASAEERAAIEAWLDADPQAQLLLHAMRDEQETAIAANAEVEVPDTEAGLATLMAAIDAPQAEAEAAAERRAQAKPAKAGFMQRLSGWLPTPGLRLAAAVGSVLVVAQAAAIAVMLAGGPGETQDTTQGPGFQTASDGGAGAETAGLGPRFLLQFPDDLTMAELTQLLADHNLRLVDSPAAGIFEAELAGGATDEAAAATEAALGADERLMLLGRSN